MDLRTKGQSGESKNEMNEAEDAPPSWNMPSGHVHSTL